MLKLVNGEMQNSPDKKTLSICANGTLNTGLITKTLIPENMNLSEVTAVLEKAQQGDLQIVLTKNGINLAENNACITDGSRTGIKSFNQSFSENDILGVNITNLASTILNDNTLFIKLTFKI